MTYDEIYNAFYLIVDKDFFNLEKDTAIEYMKQWIRNAFSTPYIKELFSSYSLDEIIEELTYELKNSSSAEYYGDSFVIDVITRYMKISWITTKVDSAVNMAIVIGGKDEKKLLDNYKNNMERLNKLNLELRKLIKDYHSVNNDYINGGV